MLGEQTVQGMEGELVARHQAQLGLRNSLLMLHPDPLAVKALDKQWQVALAGQQWGTQPRA